MIILLRLCIVDTFGKLLLPSWKYISDRELIDIKLDDSFIMLGSEANTIFQTNNLKFVRWTKTGKKHNLNGVKTQTSMAQWFVYIDKNTSFDWIKCIYTVRKWWWKKVARWEYIPVVGWLITNSPIIDFISENHKKCRSVPPTLL